mgnify:CR=1 FL=1
MHIHCVHLDNSPDMGYDAARCRREKKRILVYCTYHMLSIVVTYSKVHFTMAVSTKCYA